eukprot:gene8010-46745_t
MRMNGSSVSVGGIMGGNFMGRGPAGVGELHEGDGAGAAAAALAAVVAQGRRARRSSGVTY